jgi:hypothetical protein
MALSNPRSPKRARSLRLCALNGWRWKTGWRGLSVDGDEAQIDVDYLEERARAVLRFAHPDEIVVTLDVHPRG